MGEKFEITLHPTLGTKLDVPQDDASMFKQVGENAFACHSPVENVPYSIQRKRQACSKTFGTTTWSTSANATATNCLGLFELYDGTNRDWLYWDDGYGYYFDASLDPAALMATRLGHAHTNLISAVKVGSYCVYADGGVTTPYKWASADGTNGSKKLIDPSGGSGYEEYKFKFLGVFARRIIGMFPVGTSTFEPDISVLWTDALPALAPSATADVEFPDQNQLYVPNDDPIMGGWLLGHNKFAVYSEDSINELVYYEDYTTPFRFFTVVQNQGSVNHHSVVPYGNVHFLFNRNLGFCMYNGGPELVPISDDIEPLVASIDPDYYNLIVGTYRPISRQIAWTIPSSGGTAPNILVFYDLRSGQWTTDDKEFRFIKSMRLVTDMDWGDFSSEIGGTWNGAGATAWNLYTGTTEKLGLANDDGKLYTYSGTALDDVAGSGFEGGFVTPALNFGRPLAKKLVKEIWICISSPGSYEIHVEHAGADSLANIGTSHNAIGTITANSNTPALRGFAETHRLHRFKIYTDSEAEDMQIHKIIIRGEYLSDN